VVRLFPLLLLLGAAGPAGGDWLRMEHARVLSAHTGKLILAYIACDPGTGMSRSCGNNGADRAFQDPVLAKRLDEFYLVRVCDKNTAQELKAAKALEAIFVDADGDEISRGTFGDARSLDHLISAALGRYVAKPVSWTTPGGKAEAEDDRPWLLAFLDDRKESADLLKVLEDRTLVKFHDRLLFHRASVKRGSEDMKRWSVVQTPALIVLDPARKEVLERVQGRKSAKELKAVFQRAFQRLDAPKPAIPPGKPSLPGERQ
jgi:hypothetical protein